MLLAIQGVMGVFRPLTRSASPHYPVALHSPAAAATFSPEPCGALWPLAAGLLEQQGEQEQGVAAILYAIAVVWHVSLILELFAERSAVVCARDLLVSESHKCLIMNEIRYYSPPSMV